MVFLGEHEKIRRTSTSCFLSRLRSEKKGSAVVTAFHDICARPCFQRNPEKRQQHHQGGNKDQGVEERKGEDDQEEQLLIAKEIPGRGYQGNASSLNTGTISSATRPRPATNNNDNNVS